MIKKFFITGTDTNVGKTLVSSVLLRKATKLGYDTSGYKPISSGDQIECNSNKTDASILKQNSSVTLNDKEVNLISFKEQAPPHILSHLYKKQITKKDLSIGLKKIEKKSNWILIEGIGGWYTPLSYKETFSEWIKQEELNVIIVVAMKLGCINHAILTERAIMSENVVCSGWIANNIYPKDKYNIFYIQTLLSYINSPFLGVMPYLLNQNKTDFNKIKIELPEYKIEN